MQYAQDYDEYQPCGPFAYGDIYTGHGAGWAVQLYPYIKSYGIFLCPSDSKSKNIAYTGNSNFFGLNKKLSSLGSPSRMVMLTEMDKFPYTLTDTYKYDQAPTWNGLVYMYRADGLNNVWGGTGWNPVTGWMAGYDDGAQFGRHTDGSNYLFADGHVKWLLSQNVSPGENAPNASAAQVIGDHGTAAGSEVMTYAATFSAK